MQPWGVRAVMAFVPTPLEAAAWFRTRGARGIGTAADDGLEPCPRCGTPGNRHGIPAP